MASLDPSEDEISQVIDFAGLDTLEDWNTVAAALKNNNRNVETVVMQYFDNAESFRQKYAKLWDDSVFSGDREGPENGTGIPLHAECTNLDDVIQGVTPPPEIHTQGAVSRPPSRSIDRSPLGRMIDWTAVNAPGAPISHAQEDEDMARALRESAQEAGISVPEQESGVLDESTSEPWFGPATRSNYDQGNWAMVSTGKQGMMSENTPPPSSRERRPGAPAFLIQGTGSSGTNHLGGLLTILHEIPLARNVLLACGTPASSYGQNREWWQGQEILPPHVLARLQSGELSWGEQSEAKPNFEEEIHRLMAFLDLTERSYGTTKVLNNLLPYHEEGAEKQFYERLEAENWDKIEPFYQVVTLVPGQGDSTEGEEARFGLLELEQTRPENAQVKTLYEAIDQVMWNDVLRWQEDLENFTMALLKATGEVMVLKISGDGPESDLDIPQELYPERWLASRKTEARQIQLALLETQRAVEKAMQGERAVREWRDTWKGQAQNKTDLIERTATLWRTYRDYLDGSARFQAMEKSGFTTDKYADYREVPSEMHFAERKYYGKVEEVEVWTDAMLSHLQDRLRGFELEMQKLRARQHFLGTMLTVPDKPGRPRPMTCKKYLLRGVASSQDTMYVCSRAEADLIELEDVPQQRDQWWRLSYSAHDSNPVQVEKVEIERVLREMWRETKTPLFVYATEAALDVPRAPLSSPLALFAKAENKTFSQELSQERANREDRQKPFSLEATSPSKRKHRSDSMDSMASNRASIGSEEPAHPANQGVEGPAEVTGLSEPSGSAASEEPEDANGQQEILPGWDLQRDGGPMDEKSGVMPIAMHEVKFPEMREREGPSMFVSRALDEGPQQQTPFESMDMDMPESHE